MATPSLDQLCSDVLRLMSSCFEPRDLLTFCLACKAAHDASQRRLVATALARVGARVALRRMRASAASRASLAQNMTCKSTLSDRDQCFAQLKWCLSRSDDPLSDLTTALYKTQTALTEQSQAPHATVRPILEDVGLWIIFVCLAAWRMHMHKAAGEQAHVEVAQHDLWGILDATAPATTADVPAVPSSIPAAEETPPAVVLGMAGPEQQQQQQQQQQLGLAAEPNVPLSAAGLFQDLLAGLHRMVYSPNPSKKPGLATLNIIIHFLAQITAEA